MLFVMPCIKKCGAWTTIFPSIPMSTADLCNVTVQQNTQYVIARITFLLVRLLSARPALAIAGPDCNPCGRPLHVTVQSKKKGGANILVY
jgi:hypothetical protein